MYKAPLRPSRDRRMAPLLRFACGVRYLHGPRGLRHGLPSHTTSVLCQIQRVGGHFASSQDPVPRCGRHDVNTPAWPPRLPICGGGDHSMPSVAQDLTTAPTSMSVFRCACLAAGDWSQIRHIPGECGRNFASGLTNGTREGST